MSKGKWVLATAVLLLLMSLSTTVFAAETIKVLISSAALHVARAEALRAGFEETHPGQKVELIHSSGDHHSFLTVHLAAGLELDAWTGWHTRNHELVMKGVALDLRPYVRRDLSKKDIDDFLPGMWASTYVNWGEYGEEQYGLPYYMNVCGVAYRTDLPLEAGLADLNDLDSRNQWTWGAMREYARKLTQVVNGETTRYGLRMSTDATYTAPWVFGMGGAFFDADGKWVLGSEKSLEGLEFAQQMIHQDGSAVPWGRGQQIWTGGAAIQQMSVSGIMDAPQRTELPIDMVRRPVSPIGKRVEIFANDQWSINRRSTRPEAAWAFIKYAATDGAQVLAGLGTPPARISALKRFFQSVQTRSDRFLPVSQAALMGAVLNARRALFFDFPTHNVIEVENLIDREVVQRALHAGEIPLTTAIDDVGRRIQHLLLH
ncbi:MAG: extracellular solute-binding protein [Limnochordia bacterium]|jgi:ABC-type glycerol-3-phosphate transport system substrate-binding protein